MTLMDLLTLLGTLDGAYHAIEDLVAILRAHGHKDSDPIPPEHAAKIAQILAQVNAQSTARDFIQNTLGK